jgi:two-component system OmpR family response regulator
MRILLAEDDRIIADGLCRSLRHGGYAVDCADNGIDAETALLTLPGLEVLRRLRARKANTPVLILTALDAIDDRVRGLDLGADDYMAKPFELAELEARVRALSRRSSGTTRVMECGTLTFDQTDRCALVNGERLDLSARELGILEILLTRANRLVSKDHLVDHLCGWGEEVSHNAIEVYVHRLRRKLESTGVNIITMRGLGYYLEKPADERRP